MAKLVFEDNHLCKALFGERERTLRSLETVLGITCQSRGNELEIQGSEDMIQRASRFLHQLYDIYKRGFALTPDDIHKSIQHLLSHPLMDLSHIFTDTLIVSHRNKRITPKSFHQKLYVDAIRKNDLVFGIGPAGTGKTYLAMAMAISSLLRKEVERIILTRPAVEAGERLGFLPGNLQEKVNPYLRPLYDALHDLVELEKAEAFLAKGIVEVAPLAFMRGRTLNNAFIILDEAQNTSPEQMKMFLTRMGYDSKVVVTGDITQIDLPGNTPSGLIECKKILQHVEGLAFCLFDQTDVVRHPLVQRIVTAYGDADDQRVALKAARKFSSSPPLSSDKPSEAPLPPPTQTPLPLSAVKD